MPVFSLRKSQSCCYFGSFFYSFLGYAQEGNLQDSIKYIEPVVISGTTFLQKLSETPIPIKVIDAKQIMHTGNKRLSEVLQEQTGMVLTHNHGTGIQIQGLGAEYTLVLINGMPLLGRVAGTLDLSRISVQNINRIEIIKGPSSSLYGSDALAGVINIITDDIRETEAQISLRAETHTTLDLAAQVGVKKENLSIDLSANRYSSEGYGSEGDEYSQTVNPFQTYTYTAGLKYKLSPKLKLNIFSRLYNENIDVKTTFNQQKIKGATQTWDYNIAPELVWSPRENLSSALRFYYSGFKNNTHLHFVDKALDFDDTFYKEQYYKVEYFTDFKRNKKQHFTLGLGSIFQDIAATRYDDKKNATQYYALAQMKLKPMERWQILAGIRYDSHSVFGVQWNPKLAMDFKIADFVTLKASVGKGFKAPDFRQLYLNFTNSLIGYSVLGTQEVEAAIAKMEAQGIINQKLVEPSVVSGLKAEYSWAFNFGGELVPIKGIKLSLNVFRNNVENLINTIAIAKKNNGQSVFSYQNLDRVFTQGLEGELYWKIGDSWLVSGGYQYLEAKDVSVLDKIKNGTISTGENDAGQLIKLKPHHYFGILGRSKHSFNAKIFYQDKKGLFANFRTIYRGRYGFSDLDGNGIINNKRETAPDYFLMNVSVGKRFAQRYTVQMGVDNLGNYTNTYYTPEFSGRLCWLRFSMKL